VRHCPGDQQYQQYLQQSGHQVGDKAQRAASAVVDHVADIELYFIRPTEIPRSLRSGPHVRVNPDESRSRALYHGIARDSDYSAVRELGGQLHHALPLYMGGGHEQDSLIQAEGMARIASSAHGMLHNMIDEQDVSEFLGEEEVTLEWADLAETYDPDGLMVVLGTLFTDGHIEYDETELPLLPIPAAWL